MLLQVPLRLQRRLRRGSAGTVGCCSVHISSKRGSESAGEAVRVPNGRRQVAPDSMHPRPGTALVLKLMQLCSFQLVSCSNSIDTRGLTWIGEQVRASVVCNSPAQVLFCLLDQSFLGFLNLRVHLQVLEAAHWFVAGARASSLSMPVCRIKNKFASSLVI